jgi:Domain of unknown function (DUF4249)
MSNIKKYSFLVVIMLLIFVLNACKKELDTTVQGQEYTIVYALLDKNDARHYIRIEKAFLDKNKNAYDMAKESDSIYYSNILEVTLTDLANNNIIHLNRANGDTAGVSKDAGLFSNTPNILYGFNDALNKDHAYLLTVKNKESGNIATSQINIVNEPKFVYPLGNSTIAMDDTTRLKIRWNTGKYGRTYDLVIRFNYEEWDISNPSVKIMKSISYVAFQGATSSGLNGNEALEGSIQRTDLYRQMQILIPADPTKQRKINLLNSLQFRLFAGGEEFYKYVQVKNAQSGITAGNALPVYSNVINGLGMFSSRTMVEIKNIVLNAASADSVVHGSYTKDLNFVP